MYAERFMLACSEMLQKSVLMRSPSKGNFPHDTRPTPPDENIVHLVYKTIRKNFRIKSSSQKRSSLAAAMHRKSAQKQAG